MNSALLDRELMKELCILISYFIAVSYMASILYYVSKSMDGDPLRKCTRPLARIEYPFAPARAIGCWLGEVP